MRRLVIAFQLLALVALNASSQVSSSNHPPEVKAHKVKILEVGGLHFKDLNKNGKLDKYEDWRLPIEDRINDLISQMTTEEKVGLMVHASVQGFTGPNGIILEAPSAVTKGGPAAGSVSRPSPSVLVQQRNIRWLLTRPADPPEIAARWANNLQDMAESSRLGIPVMLSSDPRNSPARPGAAAQVTPIFSQWPEQLGFGAIGDPKVVEDFARDAREEYKAIGLRVTLAPQADVATEPRWSRIGGTFGEDANLDARLTSAFVSGFQGAKLDADGVMTVTKHWPGDGPVKDGFDPHNAYGRFQVYPGNNLSYHLIPFHAAIAAGTAGIMPGYAIPQGIDTVGMNFSKKIVQDLLRRDQGYDGVVITDWLKAMPWGVENLSEEERQLKIVEAGVDQIGGEDDPQYLLLLVHDKKISEARIDQSVRRLLKPMFEVGLFENPYVDPDRAKTVVANPKFVSDGLKAQRHSIVLLKNSKNILPLHQGLRIYAENFDLKVVAHYGQVAGTPETADVVVIKVSAPFALHKGDASVFARGVHEGTLAFAGAENADQLAAIERLAKSGRPTIICMYLDRPAIVTEFIDDVSALLVHFSSSDQALLDVIFGKDHPEGKLPLNLPRDMQSVEKQQEDAPNDLVNPEFPIGFGLSYGTAAEVKKQSNRR